MRDTVAVRAPGKLFIAGEYAVVSPGEPSVLVAVDRFVTVTVTRSLSGGSIHSPEYGRSPLRWTRSADGLRIDREHHPYDYVLAALTVVEQVRTDLGVAPRFFDLRIDSGLDDVSGRKFGLGSSAAVTVATVRALDEFYGLGLDRTAVFKVALLATIRVSPAASGGDLAASTFGGWIGYSAPDRTVLAGRSSIAPVAPLLDDAAVWEGLRIVRLPPPEDLRFVVGWTGEPASTARLVDELGRRRDAGAVDHPAFLLDSRACVSGIWEALSRGDDAAMLTGIREARRLLRRLGLQAGVEIETERLTALCDIAEAAGAAAKPSGAGGGDCGIVLAPEGTDLADILRDWELNDVRHLTVGVHPPEGVLDVL